MEDSGLSSGFRGFTANLGLQDVCVYIHIYIYIFIFIYLFIFIPDICIYIYTYTWSFSADILWFRTSGLDCMTEAI